jgi:hypothetical protein
VLIGDGWTEHGPQSLYDLVFLQELLDLSGAGREDTKVSSALQGKIGEEVSALNRVVPSVADDD